MAKVTPSPMLLNHYHLLDKLRRWNALYDVQKNCTFLTARLPLTDDVTLADKDTNSILTDNASREIQGNVAMQVMQTGGAAPCIG